MTNIPVPIADELSAEQIDEIHFALNNHLPRTALVDRLCAQAKRAVPAGGAVAVPVYVIFDGPPSHESGRFVEVETEDGKSVSVGKWEKRGDYWQLGPLYAFPLGVSEGEIIERCAKVCDELEMSGDNPADDLSFEIGTQECAAAIRALSATGGDKT